MITATVCIVISWQSSNREVVTVLEVHASLAKIHDILDKDVPNDFGKIACILAFLFTLLPCKVIKSGLCSSLFHTPLRALFLPVRLVLIIESNGNWQMFSNKPV